MNRVARGVVAITLLVVVTASNGAALALCLWGFGKCETSNPIVGEYILDGNPNATLTITPGRITSKTGPVSFSVDYTVKSTEGKIVTIEMSPPEPKETLQIEVEKDLIKIRNKHLFAGDWKKKVASR
jgi:hypothetical protein